MSTERARDVVLSNLQRLGCDRTRLDILTRYELSLLAARVAEDIRRAEVTDLTELLHAMEEVSFLRAATSVRREAEGADRETVCRMGAVFSDLLAAELGDLFPEPTQKEAARERIACVRSEWTEQLFSRPPLCEGARVALHAVHAEEACLSVSTGQADHALLPLSYENGERIFGIERLVERYDLYLTAVWHTEREGRRAALGLFSPHNINRYPVGTRYTELRVYGQDFADCAALVSACAALGFHAEEMRCARDEYDRYSARVILRAEGNAFALRIYLSMLSAGFAELGNYSIIHIAEE